jgi:hypothetical protein
VPSFFPILFTGSILAVLGWGGLVILVMGTVPTLGPRWLFFFLLVLAVSGTALPIVAFFNRRFPSKPSANGQVIVKEAVMVGVYACILAWLQLGRLLTFSLAVIVACGIILIEVLLRWNEQSRFKPKE